ncbi:MAG: hypothetical protein ACJ74C_14705 [Gaiellaceae bacterium]
MDPRTPAFRSRAGRRTFGLPGHLAVAAAGAGASTPPRPSVREWLTGARPVVGAAAAASLMLFACSWFALESGALGRSDDVGEPGPVELQLPRVAATPHAPASSPTRPRAAKTHGRPSVSAHPGATAATLTPESAVAQAAHPVGTAPAARLSPGPLAPAAPTSEPTTPMTTVTEVVDKVAPPVTIDVPAVTVPASSVSTPIASVSTAPVSITPPSVTLP